MPQRLIWRLLILGSLAISGIIFIQSYWMYKTYHLQDEEFTYSVKIALREVAGKISVYNETNLPKQGLIQRRASNTYAVNVNSVIDANVLEDYLLAAFQKHSLYIDFEYAVFDCASDELLYGSYCNLSDKEQSEKPSVELPKFDDLIYYFVVKFPSRESYLLSNMTQSIMFSVIALLAVCFFLYAIYVIMKQKQLTEQQKDFINNMTHEFKTPISSIKIASEVLMNSDHIAGNQRLSRYAEIINDQNARLNTQVEKVLNIARLERNEFELNYENINVHETLKKIIASESIKLPSNDDVIDYNFHKESLVVKADLLHFTNVISNVIDNAIKYNQNPIKITVKTEKRNNHMLLSIIDNGIGMNEEDVKKIFSKFFRVHTGDVHNVKGFGLGLYYVKTIAKAHDWVLGVNSKEKEGTTISIKIKLANGE
jgi:two-component system phosphate regulon sensor histidine kinase PhoR